MNYKAEIIIETTIEVQAKSKKQVEDKVMELLLPMGDYTVTFEAIYETDEVKVAPTKLLHIDDFYRTINFQEYSTPWAAGTWGVRVTEAEYKRIRECKPEEAQTNSRATNEAAIKLLLNYIRTM